LVVLTGPQGSKRPDWARKSSIPRAGNGFSFVNLCADMSGVLFATHVREDNIPLEQVVKVFVVEKLRASLDELPEDIFLGQVQKELRRRGIGDLPAAAARDLPSRHRVAPYRAPEAKKK